MAAITVSSTDKRDGKALALFARCADWQQGKTKDGRSFFAIPGSDANLYHMTDSRECSCADFQRARNICKHVRAVKLWMAAYRTGAVAPKPRPTATAQDDLIVLTPEGAAYLASQDTTTDDIEADPHAYCDATAATHDLLARLQAEQAARESRLRLLGYERSEFWADGEYAQRAEQIARLTACMSEHSRELVTA